MKNGALLKVFAPGFFLALLFIAPLNAQPAASAAPARPAPANQAPDDKVKAVLDLVHAGSYAQAQQMTASLLAAYPNDARLLQARALVDKLAAAPPANAVPVQQAAGPEQLTGLDGIEYDSLITLARQAQQNTDLAQQKTAMNQFMERSSAFLKKYPNDMQLWQIRAAAALILNDPDAGFEAGQKLLASGAADSSDLNLRQILINLNLKGWLDKAKIVDEKNYDWLLGTWSASYSVDQFLAAPAQGRLDYKFTKCGRGAFGYRLANGQPDNFPFYQYIVDSPGEITLPANWKWNSQGQLVSVSAFSLGSDKRTMTIVMNSSQSEVFTKTSDAQPGEPVMASCKALLDSATKAQIACSDGLPTAPQLGNAILGVYFYPGQCAPVSLIVIAPGGPAAIAGFQASDLVQSIQGKAINRGQDIYDMLAAMKPGDKVQIVVLRDGKPRTMNVVLGTRPAPRSRRQMTRRTDEGSAVMRAIRFMFLAGLVVLAPQALGQPVNSSVQKPGPANQAPDDRVKAVLDLVHAGSYAQAQQMTASLLAAYPNDARLLQAKTLVDKLAAAPPAALPEQLTGMDRVEYNSLITLARLAQQTTDLDQQKTSMKQFMDESSGFLKKHPNNLQIWQLRAAAALIVEDPVAGYEAGQKLLASGAADSKDQNLQQIMANLNLKGWLDKQRAEQARQQIDDDKKYGWLVGRWRGVEHYSRCFGSPDCGNTTDIVSLVLAKSGSGVEGSITVEASGAPNAPKDKAIEFRYMGADAEEEPLAANWEYKFDDDSDWRPVISFTLSNYGMGNKSMVIDTLSSGPDFGDKYNFSFGEYYPQNQ